MHGAQMTLIKFYCIIQTTFLIETPMALAKCDFVTSNIETNHSSRQMFMAAFLEVTFASICSTLIWRRGKKYHDVSPIPHNLVIFNLI